MARKNKGRFRRGYDPRRHELTTEERRRGYQAALKATEDNVHVYAWLYRRIRGYYRRQRRSA